MVWVGGHLSRSPSPTALQCSRDICCQISFLQAPNNLTFIFKRIQTHTPSLAELIQGDAHLGKAGLQLHVGIAAKWPNSSHPSQRGARRGRTHTAHSKQHPLVIKIWLAGWLWCISEALNWRSRDSFSSGTLTRACAVSCSREPWKCKQRQRMSLGNKHQVSYLILLPFNSISFDLFYQLKDKKLLQHIQVQLDLIMKSSSATEVELTIITFDT